MKKLIYKITPWTCFLRLHSPDIRVGNHLFVKESTADRKCWEETKKEGEANSLDEPVDVVFGGEM